MVDKWIRFLIVFSMVLVMVFGCKVGVLADTAYPAPQIELVTNSHDLKLRVTTLAKEYVVEWDTDKRFSHKTAYVLYEGKQYGSQLVMNAGQEITIRLPKTQNLYYVRAYAVYYTNQYERKVSAVSKVLKVDLRITSTSVKPKGNYAVLCMQSKGDNSCKNIYLDLETANQEYTLPVVYKAGYEFVAWKMKVDGKVVVLTTKNGDTITTSMLQHITPLQHKKRYTVYAIWKRIKAKRPVLKATYMKKLDCIKVEINLAKKGMGYMVECSDKKGFSYKKVHVLYRDDGRYLIRWNHRCVAKKQVIFIPTYEFEGKSIYVRAYGLGEKDSTGARVLSEASNVKKVTWKN